VDPDRLAGYRARLARTIEAGRFLDPGGDRTIHRLPFREPTNSGDGLVAQPNRCCGNGRYGLVHPMACAMVVMVVMADLMAVMFVSLRG
jgi:hypothetical protein